MTDTPVTELTFRQAMTELDGILAKLEANTLELEDSLEAWKRGVVLLKYLQDKLSGAEQQISVLMGQLVEGADDAVRDTTLS